MAPWFIFVTITVFAYGKVVDQRRVQLDGPGFKTLEACEVARKSITVERKLPKGHHAEVSDTACVWQR